VLFWVYTRCTLPTNHAFSQKTRLNDLSYGIKIWTDRRTDGYLSRDYTTLNSMQRGKKLARAWILIRQVGHMGFVLECRSDSPEDGRPAELPVKYPYIRTGLISIALFVFNANLSSLSTIPSPMHRLWQRLLLTTNLTDCVVDYNSAWSISRLDRASSKNKIQFTLCDEQM